MANTNLVLLTSDNQLVTTSKIIADTVGYTHHTVLQLIRKHQQELETFGKVIFQTLDAHYNEVSSSFTAENVFKNQNYEFEMSEETSGRPTEIAILNEHQTYLLIMFMRNNKTVTAVKVEFVRAFFNMRQALQNQQKQLEHHIPTDPELKAIYEQGQKRGYAIMMGYIAKNQVQGFQCFSNEIWEQMQKPAIPDGMTLVNKKSLEHALEVIKWHETNRDAFKKTFEATTAIYEQLQNIRDTAGLLAWNYGIYTKESLGLIKKD